MLAPSFNTPSPRFVAERGDNSSLDIIRGHKGENLVIEVIILQITCVLLNSIYVVKTKVKPVHSESTLTPESLTRCQLVP